MAKKDNEKVEKKNIFKITHALPYIIIFIVSWILYFLLIHYKENINTNIYARCVLIYNILEGFEPKSFLSLQSTISFWSITIMSYMLQEKENKVLGLSYKNIFFKWSIYKYFNAADCIMYLLLMLITNIVIATEIINNKYIIFLAKCWFIIILVLSFILVFYMIHLCIVAKFKKSRIYSQIEKKIRKRDRELYISILKGIVKYSINNKSECLKEEKINYDYYVDEVKILKLMKKNINVLFGKKCSKIQIIFNIPLSKKDINLLLDNEINIRNRALFKDVEKKRERLLESINLNI